MSERLKSLSEAEGWSTKETNADGSLSPLGYSPSLGGAIRQAQAHLRLEGRRVVIRRHGCST
jgi:hypothetical protein